MDINIQSMTLQQMKVGKAQMIAPAQTHMLEDWITTSKLNQHGN